MIDQSLLSGIASHFNRLAKQIERLTFESEMKARIPFSAIHKNCLEEHMKELQAWVKSSPTRTSYIYRISTEDSTSCKQFYDAFSHAKSTKHEERAYARIHKESNIFYVGSSSSLMSRFKQHLGMGHKDTYAMHINRWIPDIEGELQIQVWRFSADVPAEVIQAVEDGLWSESNPMFGRKGAR